MLREKWRWREGKERKGMEWKGTRACDVRLQRVRSILKEERKERGEKKGGESGWSGCANR